MPFSAKANHLFRAIEHGWTPPKRSGIHISREDATRMAHEGVKSADEGEVKDNRREEAKEDEKAKGQRKALRKMGKP